MARNISPRISDNEMLSVVINGLQPILQAALEREVPENLDELLEITKAEERKQKMLEKSGQVTNGKMEQFTAALDKFKRVMERADNPNVICQLNESNGSPNETTFDENDLDGWNRTNQMTGVPNTSTFFNDGGNHDGYNFDNGQDECSENYVTEWPIDLNEQWSNKQKKWQSICQTGTNINLLTNQRNASSSQLRWRNQILKKPQSTAKYKNVPPPHKAETGHFVKPANVHVPVTEQRSRGVSKFTGHFGGKLRWAIKRSDNCYSCGQVGHVFKDCKLNKKSQLDGARTSMRMRPDGMVTVDATVKGIPVLAIVDTGSVITLISRKIWATTGVPLNTWSGVDCYGVTGNHVQPLGSARIKIQIEAENTKSKFIEHDVMVIEEFANDMLIGTDLAVLAKLNVNLASNKVTVIQMGEYESDILLGAESNAVFETIPLIEKVDEVNPDDIRQFNHSSEQEGNNINSLMHVPENLLIERGVPRPGEHVFREEGQDCIAMVDSFTYSSGKEVNEDEREFP